MSRSKNRFYIIQTETGRVYFSPQEIAIAIRQTSYLVYNYFKSGTHSVKNFFYPGDMSFSMALSVALKFQYADEEKRGMVQAIIELLCSTVLDDVTSYAASLAGYEPLSSDETLQMFAMYTKDEDTTATALSDLLESVAASIDDNTLVRPADLIRWTPQPPPEIAEEWSC